MKNNEQVPDPLPRDWLPASPVPSEEDEAYWAARLQSLMAEAEPVLAEHRVPRARRVSWLEALGVRWRPAVGGAFALAASLVLALVVGAGRTGHGEPRPAQPGSVVLAAIVSGGEPAALWQGAGVHADPTLALMALESGGGEPDGGGQ